MGLNKRVLTIVFTDVIGSTALKGSLGDLGYARRIERHRAFHRMLLGAFDAAEEVETAGDSMLTVFERPSDAVAYALRARDSLRADADGLRDRFALHLGEIVTSDHATGPKRRDLFSIHVDVAARMLALAETDRILMSRVVYDSARYHLRGAHVGAGLRWTRHGLYAFKGVDEPMEVCEVSPADDPPPERPPDSEKAVCVMVGGGALSATPGPVSPGLSLTPIAPPSPPPDPPPAASSVPGPITAVASLLALLAGFWVVSADRGELGVTWPVLSDDDLAQHHVDAGVRDWLMGDLLSAEAAFAAAASRDPESPTLHLLAAAVAVAGGDVMAAHERAESARAHAQGKDDPHAELSVLIADSYPGSLDRGAWLASHDAWTTRNRGDDFGRLLLAATHRTWLREPALLDHAERLAVELTDAPIACATAADQLLASSLYDRALAALEPCVARHPQVALLRALRGEARRLSGDADGARADLLAAAELDPGQVAARFSLLRLAIAERDFRSADALEASLRDPLLPPSRRVDVLRAIAAIAGDEGRFAEGTSHLHEAQVVAERAQDVARIVRIRQDHARLAWRAGGPDQAERFLADVEQAAAAPELSELEHHTATAEVLFLRVQGAVQRGEVDQAGRLLARLESLPPERFGITPKAQRVAAARLLVDGARGGDVDALSESAKLPRCDRLWLAVELRSPQSAERAVELADPSTRCEPDFPTWRRAVAAAQVAEARQLAGHVEGARTALGWFAELAPRADADLPAAALAAEVQRRLEAPFPFE